MDAACLSGARAADARIVAKTNLHELGMLPLGTNPWFGTPTKPLDPALIPGGSSSGSAVAVASPQGLPQPIPAAGSALPASLQLVGLLSDRWGAHRRRETNEKTVWFELHAPAPAPGSTGVPSR